MYHYKTIVTVGNIFRWLKKLNIWNVIILHSAIPEVSVKYAATWVFSEVLPYQCGNITAEFNKSKEILEETFASLCKTINGTIFFTYSTLAFTVYNFLNVLAFYFNLWIIVYIFFQDTPELFVIFYLGLYWRIIFIRGGQCSWVAKNLLVSEDVISFVVGSYIS